MSHVENLWEIPNVQLNEERLIDLDNQLNERLVLIQSRFSDVRFATSLAAEDMAVTHGISKNARSIHLFTLSTGRLHLETVEMVQKVEEHYGLSINRIEPVKEDVDQFIEQYGINGFYDGEEAKKQCCYVRKVKPLEGALKGADAWITGLRRSQSVTRDELHFEELDEQRGIPKFNPIFDWSDDDLWAYLLFQKVPLHPLHLKGYPSIGCEPCTRPIRAGEDVRAGRWWWLNKESKECGLHLK
jgi:phosphoadenosine phosphosulfate reductase